MATLLKVKLIVILVKLLDLNVLCAVRIILFVAFVVKILFASELFLWEIVLSIILIVFMVILVIFVLHMIFVIFTDRIIAAWLLFSLVNVFLILFVLVGNRFFIVFVRLLLDFFLSVIVLSVF